MKVKDMKLKDLKNLVFTCHDSVNVTECYGVNDCINLEAGIKELKRRGYTVEFNDRITIYKTNNN